MKGSDIFNNTHNQIQYKRACGSDNCGDDITIDYLWWVQFDKFQSKMLSA
jgi:hypothetical protein